MINARVNERHGDMSYSGNPFDLVLDIGALILAIRNSLAEDDPESATIFQDGIKCLITDENYGLFTNNFCSVNLSSQTKTVELDLTESASNTVYEDHGWYKYVSQEQANKIIETREPRGKFVQDTGIEFVGIDNSTGDAWVEEFPDLTECLKWLNDKMKEMQ